MRKLLAGLAVLVTVGLLAAGCGGSTSKPSPCRLAGEYVKALAANAGVTIVGDKVWSVRKLADGTTLVIVRLKYSYVETFFGQPTGRHPLGWHTFYLRILSNGQVV
jgi:hypothetical protein